MRDRAQPADDARRAGSTAEAGTSGAQRGSNRRWWALAALATAQLMATLDVTVMLIALPSAQRAVGLAEAGKHWVPVAYSLTVAALLLPGGRFGDLIGRRRALTIGVIGYAAGSTLAGAAQNPEMLIVGKVVQGVFAAMLVPAALALVSVTFPDPVARSRAFAAFSATLMAGAAAGQVLGGALTYWLSWRWCLYLNVPIALAVVLATRRYVPATRPDRGIRLDVLGAALAAGTLATLVYALAEVGRNGWGSPITLGLLAAVPVLATLFLFRQARARQPLLPLPIVADRARLSANLAVAASQFAMFGVFLFLTYHLQDVSGYSAMRTGLAFLPFVAVNVLTARVVPRLLSLFSARIMVTGGLVLVSAGLGLLVFLTPVSPYAGLLLPVLLLCGVGGGLLIAPSMSIATNVEHDLHAGPASALVRTSQQVGAALGPAVLGSLAVITGHATASAWGAGILLTCAVVVALLLPRRA